MATGRLEAIAAFVQNRCRFCDAAAIIAIMLAVFLGACGAGMDAPDTAAAPSEVNTPAVSRSPSPSPTEALPSPVNRPCGFTGKDLADYNGIVQAFESYFGSLSKGVMAPVYEADEAALMELDKTTARLLARMRAGDMTAAPDGVRADMSAIVAQVKAITTGWIEANPGATPDPAQAEILQGLQRQQARLDTVVAICGQQSGQ